MQFLRNPVKSIETINVDYIYKKYIRFDKLIEILTSIKKILGFES